MSIPLSESEKFPEAAELAEEIIALLDVNGFDVKVESVQELIGDLEDFLASESPRLDEDLVKSLTKGLADLKRKTKRVLATTPPGKALRLDAAKAKTLADYEKAAADLKSADDEYLKAWTSAPKTRPKSKKKILARLSADYAKAHDIADRKLKRKHWVSGLGTAQRTGTLIPEY